jgi:hypothetical protein
LTPALAGLLGFLVGLASGVSLCLIVLTSDGPGREDLGRVVAGYRRASNAYDPFANPAISRASSGGGAHVPAWLGQVSRPGHGPSLPYVPPVAHPEVRR